MGNHIYVFGGRPSSNDYRQSVYDYNTTTGNWALSSAVLPDANTSNMAAGVLTFPEGQRVFVVGGSGTGSVVTGRTVAFNPSDGTFTNKALWPASPARIPGGWAVANNRFYVFGGFNPLPSPGITYADVWMYNPTTDTWSLVNTATLSMARGYIATEYNPSDSGGTIYLAGGAQIDSTGNLTDETIFEKFSVTSGTISAGPPLLEPKSNNQGYMYTGQFVVPAGGYLEPNHDPHVQVYDPTTATWGMAPDVVNTTRNFAKGYGTDGSLYMFGGLDPTSISFYDYNQRSTSPGPCNTPTPTSVILSQRR